MREVRTEFPKGKVVRQRYSVEELLGQGGFGAVYRVRDRRVRGNVFALKEVIDPNRRQRESFAFEGEVLKRLDHPALPRVYRVFEDEKRYRLYMLMDYIEGTNLERLRYQQPGMRFTLSQVMSIMAPIKEAVAYLHVQQPPIIHRDIKPANIIVLASGEGSVLVDFGIAKEYDRDATTTAIRHCSPGYGAPEQYVRDTNTQTDMYGLAATIYTLLTGEVPIDALYRITRLSGRGADPLIPANVLAPALPAAVAEVLQRALAVNYNDRYATIDDFWQALEPFAHDLEDVGEMTDPVVEHVVLRREGRTTAALTSSHFPPISPETPAIPPSRVNVYRNTPPGRAGRGRSGLIALGLVALALLALASGLTTANTHWLTAHYAKTTTHTVTRSAAHAPRSPAEQAVSHAISVVTPTPQATAPERPVPTQPVLSPTVPVASYPLLTMGYSGTIHNTPASVDSTMSLSQMHQDGTHISGYFSVGPGLLGSGYFTGTLSTDNRVAFLVPAVSRLLPLYFQGHLQSDGSIVGMYCSYQNDQCDYSGGGYGKWSVLPQSVTVQSASPANAATGLRGAPGE